MKITLYILLVVFAIGLTLPELLRKRLNPNVELISVYLSGPYHMIEDVGFVAMATALGILAAYFTDMLSSLSILSAFALMVVAISRTGKNLLGSHWRVIHLTSTFTAFATILVLEGFLAYHYHSWLFGVYTALYPLSVAVMYYAKPTWSAWQEKTAVIAIFVFFLTFVGVLP